MNDQQAYVDAFEGEMSIDEAIRIVTWASSGTVRHPTATCAQYAAALDGKVRCTCGLWRALKVLGRSDIGRMLHAFDEGVMPR